MKAKQSEVGRQINSLVSVLAVVALLTVGPAAAQAVPVWGSDASGALTGSRDTGVGGGMTGLNLWADGNLAVEWEISESGGLWTYDYTITSQNRDVSHAIVEVTQDNDPFNLFQGTSESFAEASGVTTFVGNGSNPGMPNPIYGVKFEWDDLSTVTFTIVTDRSPVYGVFYAKDGATGPHVAWSNALNFADYKTNETLTANDFIVRPNGSTDDPGDNPDPLSVSTPEPATAALGMLSLLAIGSALRRRR